MQPYFSSNKFKETQHLFSIHSNQLMEKQFLMKPKKKTQVQMKFNFKGNNCVLKSI